MSNANTACPEEILASIPWYPEGLSAEECGAVEAHAADCRACRAELSFMRGDEEPAIEVPDAERVYARVLDRISGDHVMEMESRARRMGRAARQVSMAAGLLVAVISGTLTTGAIWIVREAPTYGTAAADPSAIIAAWPHLQVVFREDATASEIRAALDRAGASVVSGPTQSGVYLLRLAPGTDVGAAIGALRDEDHGVAAVAEPARS
jgi:fervidolysin-like protein